MENNNGKIVIRLAGIIIVILIIILFIDMITDIFISKKMTI